MDSQKVSRHEVEFARKLLVTTACHFLRFVHTVGRGLSHVHYHNVHGTIAERQQLSVPRARSRSTRPSRLSMQPSQRLRVLPHMLQSGGVHLTPHQERIREPPGTQEWDGADTTHAVVRGKGVGESTKIHILFKSERRTQKSVQEKDAKTVCKIGIYVRPNHDGRTDSSTLFTPAKISRLYFQVVCPQNVAEAPKGNTKYKLNAEVTIQNHIVMPAQPVDDSPQSGSKGKRCAKGALPY